MILTIIGFLLTALGIYWRLSPSYYTSDTGNDVMTHYVLLLGIVLLFVGIVTLAVRYIP